MLTLNCTPCQGHDGYNLWASTCLTSSLTSNPPPLLPSTKKLQQPRQSLQLPINTILLLFSYYSVIAPLLLLLLCFLHLILSHNSHNQINASVNSISRAVNCEVVIICFAPLLACIERVSFKMCLILF